MTPTRREPSVLVFRNQILSLSETFVAQQARAMQRYDPVLVGARRVGGAELGGLPVRTLDETGGDSIVSRLRQRVGLIEAANVRALRDRHPGLLHAHFGEDGLRALPLARRLRIPLVVTFHGYDATKDVDWASGPRDWWYGRRIPALTRQASLVIAVSDHIRRRLESRGADPATLRTHHIGVDTHRFQPTGAPPEPGLIVSVGRFVEKKGFADLVHAFGPIADRSPGACLVILGDGPDRAELLAAAAAYGDRIEMPGAVPATEVRDWLGRAAVVAVPSVTASNGDTEGLPTVLVEAMATGVPVVGTSHAGIPEALADGSTGLLVGEHRPRELAEALSTLLVDPPRARAMGAAGRERAVAHFDLRRQTALLESLYDGVVRVAVRA